MLQSCQEPEARAVVAGGSVAAAAFDEHTGDRGDRVDTFLASDFGYDSDQGTHPGRSRWRSCLPGTPHCGDQTAQQRPKTKPASSVATADVYGETDDPRACLRNEEEGVSDPRIPCGATLSLSHLPFRAHSWRLGG